LANTLGLPPLVMHGMEVPVGRYSADLLCRIANLQEISGRDQFVLVENQIEASDHKHLGQILTYVVGLAKEGNAVRHVVWVAAEFRDEHIDAVNWLNTHLEGKISVFACSVEAWRIGNSQPASKFNVVAKPSNWAEEIRRLDVSQSSSSGDAERMSYW